MKATILQTMTTLTSSSQDFIFSSIYLSFDLQKSLGRAIHRTNNYPDQLLEMPRYSVKIFYFSFKEIKLKLRNCLLRPPRRRKCRSVFSKDTTEWYEALNRNHVDHTQSAFNHCYIQKSGQCKKSSSTYT